jgi:hypothetical protein
MQSLSSKMVGKLLDMDEFKNFLRIAKEVNAYRKSKSKDVIGFESVVKIFINYLITKEDGEIYTDVSDILLSQSIIEIVEDNPLYPKKSNFKSGNRYIQPDIVFIKEEKVGKEILEICEIKVVEDGNLNFFVAKNGEISNCESFKKGDFCRLFRIKKEVFGIRTVALIINFSFEEEKSGSSELSIPAELQRFMRKETDYSYDIYTFHIFEINPSESTTCDKLFKRLL